MQTRRGVNAWDHQPLKPNTAKHTNPYPSQSTNKPSCLDGLKQVILFGFLTTGIALLLSALAYPLFDFTLWKVFRRCVSIAAFSSLCIIVWKWQKTSLRSYGFLNFSKGVPQFTFGLFIGLSGLVILLIIALVTDVCRIQITPDRWKLWRTILSFIPAALLISVLEELVFRGFILKHLSVCSRLIGICASSAIYAAVHLKERSFNQGTWFELTGLFILGIVLCVSFIRTQQLFLAVGLHAVLAYGARVNKLLIAFNEPSISWWVGTSRLVNGVVNWLMLIGLGLIIIWWTKHDNRSKLT